MGLFDYINIQTHLIPPFVYIVVVGIFLIGSTCLFVFRNKKRYVKCVFTIFLLEYLFLIFGTTVFYRQTFSDRQYHAVPFWSYLEKPYGHVLLLPETVVNVCMFVPIGVLSCMILDKNVWWKIFLVGSGVSIAIEILQFVFIKGVSEFDDVFHNTLGCMIGYCIYKMFKVKELLQARSADNS